MTMKILSNEESQLYTSVDGEIIGSVIEINALADDQPIVYPNQPVTLSMQIPASHDFMMDNANHYVAACLLDDE